MSKYKITLIIIVLTVLALSFSKDVKASDGFVELRSTTGDATRCHVTSVRMSNLEYRMPFICWDIVYPINNTIANYVVWATPVTKGAVMNLGALSYGRGEFRTKSPFTNLFVTIETNVKTKTPTGSVVLRGNVEEIPLASEGKPTPTITPTNAPGEQAQPTPTQPQSTRDKLLAAFKRAGIAALIALVGLIGLIFVVTRSRG